MVPHVRAPSPSLSRAMAWRGVASERACVPWRACVLRRDEMSACEYVSSLAHIFPSRILFPCTHTTHQSSHLPVELLPFIPIVNFCAHKDQESNPPEPDALQDICSGVRAIRFLGSVFRDCLQPEIGFLAVKRSTTSLRTSSSWDSQIIFFLVAVRGTALRTSSCIDCGPLLQATHYVD